MFDSREIAQKSLVMAEQIKQDKIRKQRNVIKTGAAVSLCSVMLVGALTVLTTAVVDTGMIIDDKPIPLYMNPSGNIHECYECEGLYDSCDECEQN